MPGWVGRARHGLLGAGAGEGSPRACPHHPWNWDAQLVLAGQGQQEILDHRA